MNRPVRWYDYITINIYFLGLTTLSQTMTPLVLPLLVQQFVGESSKGTFYGNLRLWTLMAALLVQALMGMLSDRSTSRFGRRRPFIFIGTIVDLVIITLIGLSAGMEGMNGYWFLFFMILLLQISSNTAHGAQQGLIPDLVPAEKRGSFSGIKALLEIPLPLIIVPFTIGKLIGQGNMWGGLLIAMGIVTIAMLITMLVPEKKFKTERQSIDWKPFMRLLMMTALFTLVILGTGFLVMRAADLFLGITSPLLLAIVMGLVGLTAMAVCVGLGVWVSVQIGLGSETKRTPSFVWWVVNRLAFLVGANNLASFTVYFLQGRLGLVKEKAAGPASTLVMFVGIFILLATIPSGWLADRFGHKRLVAASGLIAAVGTLVALSSPSLAIIYVGGCIIGSAIGIFFSANWALGTSIVPQEQAGRFLGISNLAGAGAGAVGAFIGGPMADYITRQAPNSPGLGYILLFAIYGVMFLLSIIPLAWIKPTEQIKPG